MVNHVNLAHNVVGIIGNVISFGLFLSPVPTFLRIIKKKDTEDFQPYPYVATVLNCLLWVFYGMPFVTPDSILVVTINGIGLVIEAIYLAIFLLNCRDGKKKKKVSLFVVGEILAMVVFVAVAMLAIHKRKTRSMVVGVFCDILNVIMYTSPLLVARMVIKTKSVEYMPLYLSIANFSNGAIWTSYALIKFDPFILISNALGTLSGAAQLILYAYYSCFYPQKKGGDEVVKPSEVQLSEPPASRV